MDRSARQEESSLKLVARAVGGPRQIAGKLRRIALTLGILARPGEVRRRLERLERAGHLAAVPSRLQLALLGADMLRFFIVPGARAYYASRGIDFNFHQLLRFLDDPVSIIDPVGLLSNRDTIIGHLMQVVHANPTYDVQLLDMFEDGVDELERQLDEMLAGRHPRQETIGAIVEDPEYHRRLREYLRAWRREPGSAELLRDHAEAREDPYFLLAERTFGTLDSAMRYALRLPRDPRGAVEHARRRRIRPDLCDPEVVADVLGERGDREPVHADSAAG